MRLMFDFECPDGHITESLINSDENTAPCKECGKPASRMISPVRCYLDPYSGHFPGATETWAKGRQKKIQEERKTTANHGEQKWGSEA